MITGSKEYLDGIVKTHQCPEHGHKLVVAWAAEEDSYVIRCGEGSHPELAPLKHGETQQREFIVEGHFPEEVTRQLTSTQQFKTGQLAKVDPLFNLLPSTDLATGERLPIEMVTMLIDYAGRYGLDAYRGHVLLMYGKPYISIDGYLWHANQTKQPYNLESRPLTEVERAAYQIPEGASAWLAKCSTGPDFGVFTGLGVVTKEEMTEVSKKDKTKLRSPVVAAHPWQLAQKRAEWQALRRAFPIGETEKETDEA